MPLLGIFEIKVWGLELYGVAGVLINSDGFLEVQLMVVEIMNMIMYQDQQVLRHRRHTLVMT